MEKIILLLMLGSLFIGCANKIVNNMSWKKKRKTQEGKNKYYSLSNKLKKESRSHDEFEVMLNNLSLEEIIGLKLELAAKAAGGYLYGIPIAIIIGLIFLCYFGARFGLENRK